jgi:hypothetical protein
MTRPDPNVLTSAAAIATILQALPSKLGLNRPNSEWTRRLKEEIGDLGITNGWKVCTAGFEGRFDQEWLYDLTWYRNDAEGRLCDVGLVLESEWDHDYPSIKVDFEKLLLAKAPLKVMVFEGYDKNVGALAASLKDGIRAFRTRDESEMYLLAGFNINKFKMEISLVAGA